MSTQTTDRPAADVAPRELIPTPVFHRLVTRIADEHDLTREYAERIMEQTLGFLYACALNPDRALSPSQQVDIGWHTFILHTRAYVTFCQSIAGWFIHHAPDEPGSLDPAARLERIGATIAAMRAAGLPVDMDLWQAKAECSQCYAGCADDPSPATSPAGGSAS
ncbi:glycine-rich domain-containing protein [Nonomuraea sp. H19]|uniref:glycine-rich domain-containing protein n=1 Tax=Nonomuraea sp. H19 TaxID=3452206 RepID=UPI003F8B7D2D